MTRINSFFPGRGIQVYGLITHKRNSGIEKSIYEGYETGFGSGTGSQD